MKIEIEWKRIRVTAYFRSAFQKNKKRNALRFSFRKCPKNTILTASSDTKSRERNTETDAESST